MARPKTDTEFVGTDSINISLKDKEEEEEPASPRFLKPIGDFLKKLPVGLTLKLSNVPDIPYHHIASPINIPKVHGIPHKGYENFPTPHKKYPIQDPRISPNNLFGFIGPEIFPSSAPIPITKRLLASPNVLPQLPVPASSLAPSSNLIDRTSNRLLGVSSDLYRDSKRLKVIKNRLPDIRDDMHDVHDHDYGHEHYGPSTSFSSSSPLSDACKYVSCRMMALFCASRHFRSKVRYYIYYLSYSH